MEQPNVNSGQSSTQNQTNINSTSQDTAKTEEATGQNEQAKPKAKDKAKTKSKNKTTYRVDGKIVYVSWFDKFRMSLMSRYEKQAFLAEKLLKQEKRNSTTNRSENDNSRSDSAT